VPPFSLALLPASFAPWVADIADRVQCPPDFVAVGVMVAAAAVIGRQIAIRPKRQDDWAVVPTLWGLAVGPPGSMKSPALAEALRPLRRLITDAQARYEEHRLVQRMWLAEQKARRHDLARRLRDAVAGEEPTAVPREPVAAARPESPPVEQRYLVNDTTVEKLGELLNHHPNGLLLFRDELSGFLHTMDRPGHENARAFYCEAWNGTGAYTYDRIGRGTLHIRAACVSVLGGIQPGPLERYLREVFAGRGDDGLLQRFQLTVWPDGGGRWRNVDRWPHADARARVNEVFQRLTTLAPAALGAEELTPEELPFLRFDGAAQAHFDAWRGDLEQMLRAEEDHPVWRSHVAKYRSLMPTLALIGHLIDGVAGGPTGPVSGGAAARAVAWCAYLQGHARRLYASVTDRAQVAAARLAAQLTHGRLPSPFTARDVYRNEWTGLTEPRVVQGALAYLEELGWLRSEAVRIPDGGRPSVRFHPNPRLAAAGAAGAGRAGRRPKVPR
jgi:putative DNA primase/helicase